MYTDNKEHVNNTITQWTIMELVPSMNTCPAKHMASPNEVEKTGV